jgi:hypothetical protein
MGSELKSTAGPAIEKQAISLRCLQTSGRRRSFIDEIHRLLPALEEKLYPAMEDYQLDLLIGQAQLHVRSNSNYQSSRSSVRQLRRTYHRSTSRSLWHRLSSRLLSA